jgi:hypothetical protein
VSLPSSANQPVAQKPGSNIYTVMLILSFCFIVTATVILSLELAKFGDFPWWKVTAAGAGGS